MYRGSYSEYYFCRNVFATTGTWAKEPILMVRTDQWKLNYLAWDRCELFHVANDPHEFRNRIEDPGCAAVAKNWWRSPSGCTDRDRLRRNMASFYFKGAPGLTISPYPRSRVMPRGTFSELATRRCGNIDCRSALTNFVATTLT
jgi:hypothetical protein